MKRWIHASTAVVTMDRQAILNNLKALDDKLRENEMTGEIDLFGGAVMCLGLDARESTHDVDALFSPKADIRELIHEVAVENGLPDDWMNDGVKGFVSPKGEFERFGEDIFTNLRVFMTTPEYLLAMKCLSCRFTSDSTTEIGDIKFLINYLSITNVDEAEEIILRYYPASRFKPKTHYMLLELFHDIQ